jgi:hypothetical protein
MRFLIIKKKKILSLKEYLKIVNSGCVHPEQEKCFPLLIGKKIGGGVWGGCAVYFNETFS